MAILAIFTGNTTKDDYEKLREEVDWERNWAPGALIHVADVWKSADKLNAFVEQRLMPAFQKLGMNPPNVEVYPAHNINAHASISKYQVQ
jgi:hypothetical protein